MDQTEARQFIMNNVAVTRQKVVLAKGFVVQNFSSTTNQLVDSFLRYMQAPLPEEVLLYPSADIDRQLQQVAISITWRLAAYEAVWGLIHANVVLPTTAILSGGISQLRWTTMTRTSGGTAGLWRFDELSVSVPAELTLAPSCQGRPLQPLADPDLYLHEINIPNLHPEIEAALREAVTCFRYDLYTACLGMLGKASEVAWTELGLALTRALPATDPAAQREKERVSKHLVDPFSSISKRIAETVKLYARQDWLKPLVTS